MQFSKWRESLTRTLLGEQLYSEHEELIRNQRHLTAEIAALRDQLAGREELTRNLPGQLSRMEKLLTAMPATSSDTDKAVSEFGNPAVSIVLPTHNRAAFVVEAIASVQAQTFAAWELLVLDDGSDDETRKAMSRFADDRRIKYIRQAHGGVAKARNIGLAAAAAPLIAYLDSDNLWYPGFLAAVVTYFCANPDVDTVYGALVYSAHWQYPSCILWKEFSRDELMGGNYIDINAFVHRKSLVSKFGNWDEKLKRLTDWDLIIRYTKDKPAVPINVLSVFYRKCDGNRITDIESVAPAVAHIKAKWANAPQ